MKTMRQDRIQALARAIFAERVPLIRNLEEEHRSFFFDMASESIAAAEAFEDVWDAYARPETNDDDTEGESA